jgi:D-alanine-D-alanine ligase-like ATP-grasp enzyme
MNSIYTTTITDEARRRGIVIRVIEPRTPIFVMRHGGREIRCYNSLTDHVGAVSFHMAQNKHLANHFLRAKGFVVPDQELFVDMDQAGKFLRRHRRIVVKPCTQWGGRGVSVGVTTVEGLRRAVKRARCFEEEIALEQSVRGEDYRLIFVNYRYVAAILRRPATVMGNGVNTVKQLVMASNRRARVRDRSNVIPLDVETGRNLAELGWAWDDIPQEGQRVQVRLTSNYHTGGTVDVVTGHVPRPLIQIAKRVVRELKIPVIGIDFLVDTKKGRHWIIELSPDLAISPPEGEAVAKRFLDYLFPETREGEGSGFGGQDE